MKSFIELCVADILQKHHDLANTTIVFPSKRAIVYFRKELGRQITAPVFSPKLTVIQDFCLQKQHAAIPDDFTLVYNLYLSYRKISNSSELFEDFYPWGEMLLADFNDVEKYQIRARDIFSNIADYKEIDDSFSYLDEKQKAIIKRFWNTTKIDTDDENDVRRKFVSFWRLLLPIYEDFNERLSAQQLSYEGKAIRAVAEASTEEQDKIFGNETFIFIGFNALSTSEASIFKFLQNRKQARFYWDYDTYYKNDDTHEAGIFIRKNLNTFKNELPEDAFANFATEKNIRIIKVPNAVAQAKLAHEIIKDCDDKQLEDTAIILADEKLIDPILHSLPEDIQYNITLGYPIRSSAAYTFFESLLDMCVNKSGDRLYYKDIIRICENPLIPASLRDDANRLRKHISEKRCITITESQCTELCDLPFIFQIQTSDTNNYITNIKDCISTFCQKFTLQPLDKGILYTIFKELAAIEKIVQQNAIKFEKIKFVNTLLKRSLQDKNIAIEGTPIKGLQILGILEARLLDFRNIIITSLIEGNLPKTSPGSSFIPYNLRTAFGMPTIKEQSAMYSYYFYRLIQRCENLTILHHESGNGKKCERSRYIMQLIYESPFKVSGQTEFPDYKTLSGITIEDIGFAINETRKPVMSVSKQSEDVQAYLKKLKDPQSKTMLTPSSLQNYMQCGLKFYFANIKRLKKPKEFSELPEANDLGTYFHDTMKCIYERYRNQTISEETINTILADEQKLVATILKVMQENNATSNVANEESKELKITLQTVKNVLEFDKSAPFTVKTLEEYVTPLVFGNGVKIGGIIDRMDLCNGTYRIIDYKNGKCQKIEDKISTTWEKLFDEDKTFHKEAFQVCLYSFILKTQNKDNKYSPHLFFTQSINVGNPKTAIEIDKTPIESFEADVYDTFKEKIEAVVDGLIDESTDFQQTTKPKENCLNCDFKKFCAQAGDENN